MGKVYKPKNSRKWRIDYRDENGKRVQKAVSLSRKRAKTILLQKMAEVEAVE